MQTAMTSEARQLDGLALGISISRSDDSEDLGFTGDEVNNAVREISSAVLAQGGRVVFGHDWRPEGVMAEIYSLALNYQSHKGDTALIRNFVPWPSTATLSREDRKRHSDVLEVIETRPDSLNGSHDPTRALRVRSLTHLREELTAASDSRICIGGRTAGSGGRCSGIVEEAVLMIRARKPLYLTGIFGGASQQVIDALTGQGTSDLDAFRPSTEVAEAMEQAGDPLGTFGINPDEFTNYGLDALSRDNHLSIEENKRLFEATHLHEVLGILLTALGRLRRLDRPL